MWSVPNRRSEPSIAVRTLAGELSSTLGPAAGVRDETEFRGDHYVVAAPGNGTADEFLVDERAVDLGGVEEIHAEVQRPPNGADGLLLVAARPRVVVGHRHGAQADA